MQRVLMIAFQFPPFSGSVGVQRTLRFVQHLPHFGWQPAVVSAWPRAYETTDPGSTGEVPDGTVVRRTFALDAKRHLGIAGRYSAALARPDRWWMTWVPSAVAGSLRLIRQIRPDVIWATYPIPAALRIGSLIHRLTGLPWIADFRDPMAQEGYPADHRTWLTYKAIEEDAISSAAFSVFTTQDAAQLYRVRYRDAVDRIRIIENGYDEDSFAAVESAARSAGPLAADRITLLHSGVIYSPDRDPKCLFAALARLKRRGLLDPARFRIRFRAPQFDAFLRGLASEMGVLDLIESMPPIPYREALEEMIRADALVLLSGADFSAQVPAKLYEYLRAARPILGLTDPLSSSARVLHAAGVHNVAPLESVDGIETLLANLLAALATATAQCPEQAVVRGYSRRARAGELAALLQAASSSPAKVT